MPESWIFGFFWHTFLLKFYYLHLFFMIPITISAIPTIKLASNVIKRILVSNISSLAEIYLNSSTIQVTISFIKAV